MDDQQTPRDGQMSPTRPRTDGPLPLTIRQRLWDQIWAQLLAPPVDAGDRAPVPKQGDRREGGQR